MWMSLDIFPSRPEFGKALYSCSRPIVTLNETIRDGAILIDKLINPLIQTQVIFLLFFNTKISAQKQ